MIAQPTNTQPCLVESIPINSKIIRGLHIKLVYEYPAVNCVSSITRQWSANHGVQNKHIPEHSGNQQARMEVFAKAMPNDFPAMLDKETGEIIRGYFDDGSLFYDQETGENSYYPTFEYRRERARFLIPKHFLRNNGTTGHRKNKCIDKLDSSYPLASREKLMNLQKEVILGYNKTSHLLLLIPSLFIMPKLAAILIFFTEVLLHIWAHKKNNQNRNPNIYYRSPMHITTTHFCGICRDQRTMDRIEQLQGKRMRQMQNYFRNVARNIA
ncbi:uncharacterized protein LOC129721560 isoform X3 [Wyeomyia smithii]|uniref:uncharacterized protein LOC129721560 isoform X3 n=2 Tax=Wyeomyia smithii TaxID=174621 RepID=UPI002467AEAD|nr:uncharacterized protein LOC129721560 isoform X3 [Wyeomyia smithii]